MKHAGKWLAIGGMIALFTASCFDPPQYSPIPAIEFDNIIFKDIANTSDPDSLILTIKFKDGDGNLGLDPTETDYPYNDKTYFVFSNGKYVTYETKRTVPGYDTLPDFIPPYSCINWEIKTVNQKIDTFYFQLNSNHYNIYVHYFIKNNDGSFREFDWQKEFVYPNCGIPFDGRFPILSKDLSQKNPLDGKIRYGMASTGFLILFSIKTLKLKVTIQDRDLNKSNTIETPEFTLQSIKKSG
jgi:hypothetical protein